jgi:hypothetical protein
MVPHFAGKLAPRLTAVIATVTLRVVENLVTADAAPDDVRFARTDGRAVLKGGAAISRPSYLPNTFNSSDTLDA